MTEGHAAIDFVYSFIYLFMLRIHSISDLVVSGGRSSRIVLAGAPLWELGRCGM